MTNKIRELLPDNYEASFALYEQQHALTDGLFGPVHKIKDGELHFRKVVRETKITWKNEKTGKTEEEAVTLTFIVPLALNTQAESVLLAIIKISGLDGLRIEPGQPTLPSFKDVEGKAKERPRSQITCKLYQLLKQSGMRDDKRSYQRIEFYLKLLARVTIEWHNHTSGWRGASHLIDYATNDDGSLVIHLNWRLTGALFGNYYYAVINLDERHALSIDAAKTLHRWLSAHIWEGKSDYLLYSTLIGHIWSQEATPAAQRKRLERLKSEVLPDIAKLNGWTVETDIRGARISHLEQKKVTVLSTSR